MNANTKKLVLISMISSAFMLLSCTKAASQKDWNEMTTAEKQQVLNDKINNYFVGLSDWSQVSPLKADNRSAIEGSKKISIEKEAVDNGSGEEKIVSVSCETEKFSLTKTPDEVVMQNPAAGTLYPGALIQGDGYLQGPGGIRELPIRKRSSMIIATDLANEKNAIQMDTVNYGTYEQARAQLLKAAGESKSAKIGRAMYTQIEASQSTQAALDLGFSATYMGLKASGEMQNTSTTKEKTFMVVFKQNAYTISAVAPASPAGFFSNELTTDDLKTQESLGNISPKNPPLYVSSVTYGRMLIYTVTSKASKSDIQGALNVTYNNIATKVDAKVKAKYQKIMNESTVKIVFFGGESAPSIAMIKSGDLADYFNQSPSLESFEPISYVLRNIKDNSIAKVSETTEYTKQECTPLPPKSWTVKITIDKILMHYTGASSKGEIYGNLSLNGHEVWSRTREEYAPTKNGAALEVSSSSNSIMVDLQLPSKENWHRPSPVLMRGQFSDADASIWGPDDKLATFNEYIGYTADGQVLPEGSYKTSHNRNIEIFYSIKKIKANY